MLESMLTDICGPDIYSSIYDTLAINLFSDDGKYSIILDAIRTLHSLIVPIGIYMMFIYFMISLTELVSSDGFTLQQVAKRMFLLLVAKYLMDHGFEIMELLFNLGMSITAEINNAMVGGGKPELIFDAKEMIDTFRANLGMTGFLKIFADLILFVYLLIPWGGSWLMRLAINIICYSRVIEIYCRAVLAPIALSDFYHGGLQSSGWRFLKNFVAVCLQGATILLISIIFSLMIKVIVVEDSGHPMAFLGSYLAFYGSSVMLMVKSLPLTKELVGAN